MLEVPPFSSTAENNPFEDASRVPDQAQPGARDALNYSAASFHYQLIAHQTIQEVKNLTTNSPSFNRLLDKVTEHGQNPLTIHYGPTDSLRFGAEYNWNDKKIVVDPSHPGVDPEQGGSGVLSALVFEMTNAKHSSEVKEIANKAQNGFYENLVAHRQNDGQMFVPAGVLYGQDQEKVEYKGVRIHHEIMGEAQAAGMPLHPRSDTFAESFAPANPRNWNDVDNYLADQERSGHLAFYAEGYNRFVESAPNAEGASNAHVSETVYAAAVEQAEAAHVAAVEEVENRATKRNDVNEIARACRTEHPEALQDLYERAAEANVAGGSMTAREAIAHFPNVFGDHARNLVELGIRHDLDRGMNFKDAVERHGEPHEDDLEDLQSYQPDISDED